MRPMGPARLARTLARYREVTVLWTATAAFLIASQLAAAPPPARPPSPSRPATRPTWPFGAETTTRPPPTTTTLPPATGVVVPPSVPPATTGMPAPSPAPGLPPTTTTTTTPGVVVAVCVRPGRYPASTLRRTWPSLTLRIVDRERAVCTPRKVAADLRGRA